MIDEERIRKFVEKKIEERNGVLIHGAIFGIVSVLMFGSWVQQGFSTFLENFPVLLIVMFFWGVGVFFHFMSYYNQYGAGRDRREAMVQRELEKERDRLRRIKVKNDDLYDDADEFSDLEVVEAQKRKRK